MADSTTKETLSYAASVNPPRRAKRARTDAPTPDVSPIVATTPQRQQRPQLLPKDAMAHRSNIDPESSEEEDEYDPALVAPPPKRRGRKPGTMSRSVRESQRKLNHSRIEKARRTKINETLATLSELVNVRERQKILGFTKEDSAPVAEAEGKGKTGEKEFKLDVLVKAVSYMQELITRVKVLESRQCESCSGLSRSLPESAPSGGKRKRDETIEEEIDIEVDEGGEGDDTYVGDDEKGAGDDMDDELEGRPVVASSYSRRDSTTSIHPTPSPRLPPIASWLPHPYVDPSCIAAMGEQPSNLQLPSPPPSGNFRSAAPANMQSLPSLTLPGPARPTNIENKTSESRIRTIPIHMSPRRMSNTTSSSSRIPASPAVSPTWTPEDETAATVLLHMSSSPSSVSSSSSMGMSKLHLPKAAAPSTPPSASRDRTPQSWMMHVQTPSSMLGM